MSHPSGFPRRTLWERYARKLGWLAKPLLAAACVTVGGGSVTLVKAVLATPSEVHALKVKVDTLAARQERQATDLQEVSQATWTFVALRCLELDDSAFVSSRLPCGKAFMISGVVRRLSR